MTPLPPPPAAPYHRLARTPAHRWWRAPLGTLFVLFAWPILGTLLVAGGGLAIAAATGNLDTASAADAPKLSGTVETAATLVFLAAAIPVVLLAARWIERRRAGTVSSVEGRLRWGWLGTCLAIAVPTTALMIAVGWALAPGEPLLGGAWIGWEPFARTLAMLLVLVPLQAAAEEYLFRGWLLQTVGAFFRTPWFAIALQAALFAVAHGWQGGVGGFVFYAAFGAVAGVLTVRTGGLEAAIALHITNNVLALALAAAGGALGADPGELALPSAAVHSLVLMAYAGVVLIKANGAKVATVAPAVRERVPAPAL